MPANDSFPWSRRRFLGAGALMLATGLAAGLSGLGMLSASRARADDHGRGDPLALRFSGYAYPRISALSSGKITVPGATLEFSPGKIGDMNHDLFAGSQRADFTEIGLHPFILAHANGGFRDYTLIPVFPLRVFRHKSIFIRTDRGIEKPGDLKGRRIATPGYSSTSLTWIRGMLEDEYGVSPADIRWVQANKDSTAEISGVVSGYESVVPDDLPMEEGTPGKDESDLLESGEVDALFHAVQPRGFIEGNPLIERLFADSRAAEQAYYRKTGIFPIMHAVAVRRSLLEREPWLAKALFDAYAQAKAMSYRQMMALGWAFDALPWYGQELEETRALMGPNFYSYGLDAANRNTVDRLCHYSHVQGMARQRLTVEDLFASQSLEFRESG